MSIVQICNRGGSKYLGLQRINNLNEGTPESEEYMLHYEDERRALLQAHWWIFAKSRVALAQLANDRPNEWEYKYQKPSNILEVHWVNDPQIAQYMILHHRNPDTDRHNSSDFIYCNIPEAYMEYTRDEKNTDLFPQYFRDALSAKIASAVGVALTESVSRTQYANNSAVELTDIAIAEDEQNAPPIEMPDADYLRGRIGGDGFGHDYNSNGWRGNI